MNERQQITIEILERNGFKFEYGVFRWFNPIDESYYTGYESARYDVRDGRMEVMKEYPDGTQKQVCGEKFGYVDELQAALTLCEIDKTIEL